MNTYQYIFTFLCGIIFCVIFRYFMMFFFEKDRILKGYLKKNLLKEPNTFKEISEAEYSAEYSKSTSPSRRHYQVIFFYCYKSFSLEEIVLHIKNIFDKAGFTIKVPAYNISGTSDSFVVQRKTEKYSIGVSSSKAKSFLIRIEQF